MSPLAPCQSHQFQRTNVLKARATLISFSAIESKGVGGVVSVPPFGGHIPEGSWLEHAGSNSLSVAGKTHLDTDTA